MSSQKKVDAEQLPYFELLRKVPIKWIEWATKEVPVAYIIADCSNNPDSYNKYIELLQKRDLYKALEENLKPSATVQLNYGDAKASEFMPSAAAVESVKLEFQGKDILSRGGIYDTLLKFDPQFYYLHIQKKFLEVFKVFIDRNKTEIQKVLLQKQYSSPLELFRDLMKNSVLKHSFFSEIESKLGSNVKKLFLDKWEQQNG